MRNWKKVLSVTVAAVAATAAMPAMVFAEDDETFKIGVDPPNDRRLCTVWYKRIQCSENCSV